MHVRDVGPPGARDARRIAHALDQVQFDPGLARRGVPGRAGDERRDERDLIAARGERLRERADERHEAARRRSVEARELQNAHRPPQAAGRLVRTRTDAARTVS